MPIFDFVQRGRTIEAEAEFEKLLGGVHVKPAMSELSKSDRGDESGSVKLSELLYGCHARGTYHNCFYFFCFPFYEILCVEQYMVLCVQKRRYSIVEF